MNKYQVTISFLMDDTFMKLLPAHREYINTLIEQGIIDHYIVTMESQQAWITINAPSKEEVILQLEKTPVYPLSHLPGWGSHIIRRRELPAAPGSVELDA